VQLQHFQLSHQLVVELEVVDLHQLLVVMAVLVVVQLDTYTQLEDLVTLLLLVHLKEIMVVVIQQTPMCLMVQAVAVELEL